MNHILTPKNVAFPRSYKNHLFQGRGVCSVAPYIMFFSNCVVTIEADNSAEGIYYSNSTRFSKQNSPISNIYNIIRLKEV